MDLLCSTSFSMDYWSDYIFFNVGIAFLGYVLPWGQMSFWAATLLLI